MDWVSLIFLILDLMVFKVKGWLEERRWLYDVEVFRFLRGLVVDLCGSDRTIFIFLKIGK